MGSQSEMGRAPSRGSRSLSPGVYRACPLRDAGGSGKLGMPLASTHPWTSECSKNRVRGGESARVQTQTAHAEVAESADAPASKVGSPRGECGFDPHLRQARKDARAPFTTRFAGVGTRVYIRRRLPRDAPRRVGQRVQLPGGHTPVGVQGGPPAARPRGTGEEAQDGHFSNRCQPSVIPVVEVPASPAQGRPRRDKASE
jgi:hypothetical protein